MSKKIALFGAGQIGMQALKYFGSENVAFFIDNDKNKQNKSFEGVPVYALDDVAGRLAGYELIVSTSNENFVEIDQQLKKSGIFNFTKFQTVINRNKYKSNPEVVKLKDAYKGKRCFIIGTGPSLTIEDLETLKANNEITFASNKIFKLFDKTNWRPDLYCVVDYKILYQYFREICDLKLDNMFISNINDTIYAKNVEWEALPDRIKVVNLVNEYYDTNSMPSFSFEPDKYVFEGYTVTYAIMQLAAFLGFEEMYLLGIDHNYQAVNGAGENDHFCKDYCKPNEVINAPRLEHCNRAYEKAEAVSRAHGFRIFNATRGGKLEIFERVDFDTLF